ncbi:2OG-Fe(II) oxygenase [Francisellaceae bacterium]|nr:2OG-Fe(II) oxygenase [Francisellaceae bacterium]
MLNSILGWRNIELERDKIVISCIEKEGYVVIDDFLPRDIYFSLKQYAVYLEKENEFDKAGIGKDIEHQIKTEIRGDWVYWLSKNDQQKGVQYYFNAIDKLRALINYSFFLSLTDFEAHFAVYPIGKFYLKHRDQFKGNDIRQISLVFFLNDEWKPSDQGELCVDNDKETKIIEPIANRLVCFKSSLEHEVLPTNAKRYSLTGWLKKESVPFID